MYQYFTIYGLKQILEIVSFAKAKPGSGSIQLWEKKK